jgi:hypothetical protein
VSAAGGADAPQGPGWWLASDGRYYPPELAPGTGTANASAAPKKKVVKKKVAAKPPAGAPPQGAAARPAKKKVVKKKAVAKAAPPDPTVDLTEKRPGHLKYTAKPPPSDQVAARRIQAKEQMVLLAGARQTAALRLLANLGEPEPVLVGVGGRDLDARSHHGNDAGGSTSSSSTSTLPGSPPVSPDPSPASGDDREPTPDRPPSGGASLDVAPTPAPEVAEATASVAPPAAPEVEPEPPVEHAAPVEPAAVAPPSTTAAPAPPAPAETEVERPVPHQPERGPEPAPRPMGTDVPFMEVKGSALGTDIDRIGEKILIYADRVELRDRTNGVRQSIRYDQLAAVEVQKKMMGPSLVITSVAGGTMTAKALRPELATGAKAMIEKHAARFRGETPAPAPVEQSAPPPPPPPDAANDPGTTGPTRTHRSVLTAMLDELHAAGILSPEEMEQKRALIERNDRA